VSKLVLSYSRKDEALVEELYRRLTRDGVDCFFDKESIEWDASWVIELDKGINEARYAVLIYTPDYFESEWGTLERISALIKDPLSQQRTILPLLLEPCGDRIPMSYLLE
jgi:hypothetical protein